MGCGSESDTVLGVGSTNSKVQLDSSLTLSLKMTNKKEGSILTESNLHSDKVFSRRWMKTFIIALMKGIPNKHTCLSLMGKLGLIRGEIMDIYGTPNYTKGNEIR